ncbi:MULTISPECIES: BglG family transcription antiterminator [Clostridium]|uniref:BglG family transcription antiterminator n=1 Tax=Clostridium TaxID=1485 RepID=UPI000827013E|nr:MULTISPECIES: PTS sugar transporter subunit IIA [Clostridium]PJI08068.1 hypothetical protein CUB90_09380 [Clostridium sp. CT7]
MDLYHMNKRQTKILKILLYENNIVASDILANISGVTAKTVRKDIKVINEILKDKGAVIKSKMSYGYYIQVIDEVAFSKFKDDINDKSKRTIFFMTNKNAIIYYIIRTIVSVDGFIKLDDIANDLFMNRTTISLYMSKARKILNKYRLRVVNTPKYGIKVVGDEFNIRMCLVDSHLYYKEGEFSEVNYEKFIQANADTVEKISEFIDILCSVNEISIPLMGIKKISLYIMFQINRIKAGKLIEKFDDYGIYTLISTSSVFKNMNTIKKLICNLYCMDINDAEIKTLYSVIFSCMNYNIEIFKNANNYDFYLKITVEAFKYIDDKININMLENEKYIDEFQAAIFQMIYRDKVGVINFQFDIKAIKCDIIGYNVAVLFCYYIWDKYNIKLNENELIHIIGFVGSKISDYSDEINKKKVLIISSIRGVAISKSIELRLKSGIHPFNVDVDIKDINKLNFLHNDYDCVIADCDPEDMRNLKNTVYISKLFSQQEVLNVKRILLNLDEKSLYINNIFTEKLYFKDVDLNTKEDVLKFLCTELLKRNVVDDRCYKDIEIREAINSSETDSNVALPNFLREYSEHGFAVTLLLKKPIIWDNEFVKVVFLIQYGYKTNIEDIMFLNNCVRELCRNENISMFLKQNDYEDFKCLINKIVNDPQAYLFY